MFNKMRDRFNRRGGKVRLIVAALVCAAGLALGVGGTAVVAQIAGGNPTPSTETTNCDAQVACTISIPTTPPVVVPCYENAPGGVESTTGTAQVSGASCGYIYANIAGQLTLVWCPEAQIVGTCQVAIVPPRANAGTAEGGAS